MKLELFNAKANNIWKRAAGHSMVDQMQFELTLSKKLLNFFQVGNYFYFIFNVSVFDLELVSGEIEILLGYHPSEFTINMLLEKTHPDDRPYFLNFENKAGEFLANLPAEKLMQYKIRYDYRIRKKNGEYIRVLQQSMVIDHDENGGIVRTLATHTDISYLKPEGKPVFSIIGFEGEPSYINVDVKKVFAVSKDVLTNREKQVLALLVEGMLSKEISDILDISKETVDKHRKNMLSKTNLNNTRELVVKAIKEGWI